MKRLAFAVTVVLVFASAIEAGLPRSPIRPYEFLNAPPEAVAGLAGGPSVVAVDTLKQTVTGYTEARPCGMSEPYDGELGESDRPAAKTNYALWIAGGLAGTAAFVLLGLRLIRRSA